jgi:hypothetical protein
VADDPSSFQLLLAYFILLFWLGIPCFFPFVTTSNQSGAHCSLALGDAAHKLGCVVKVFIVINVKFFLFARNHLFRDVTVRALKAQYHWLCEFVLSVGVND